MAVTAVKWGKALYESATTTAKATNTAAAAAAVSSRDTAVFSTKVEQAAKTAAEEVEKSLSSESSTGEDKKTVSEIIKEQTDKIDSMFKSDDYDKSKDRALLVIKQKIRGGLTLSASEAKYLSKNDPDSYSNYQTIVQARRQFRSQLRCCRNKDDVYGMRMANAVSALAAYKKAIKQGGDGAEVAGLNMAIEREISSYSRSGRFQSLPTIAERNKYQVELAKARRFEAEKRQAERMSRKGEKKKQVKVPGDGKRTVAQVQNSYLGRKIRNADRGGSCGIGYA